jgi:hypothetical protein
MNPLKGLRIATIVSAVSLTLAGIGGLPAPASACRLPRPDPAFSMEILVDGRPLQEYTAGGTTYIEALKGREYDVRLTNRTGERVAVALAVDGLNSIDAKHTPSRDARKWILAPWESITLSGWQTGSQTARRFVFTSESSSYGAWLGRTSDLGVISAAFFREVRRPAPIAAQPTMAAPEAKKSESNAPAPSGSNRADRSLQAGAAADDLAATGIGREIEHRVVRVDFDQEDSPASTINLRYEYHDALVRLGVVPACDDALARRERARGFAEPGFAPDPFRPR